jgi:hypothetical protein
MRTSRVAIGYVLLPGVVLLALGAPMFARDRSKNDVPRPDPYAESIALSIKIVSHSKDAPDAVPRIISEADRIWRRYGVRLTRDGDPAERRLRIIIVDDPPPGIFAAGEGAHGLGWITFLGPAKPRDVLYLSWKRAAALLGETNAGRTPLEQMPETLRKSIIGRALGRTLAHEIGHYLFASTAHTRTGLMRPSYSTFQLFDASGGGFDLGAEEQRRLAPSAYVGAGL